MKTEIRKEQGIPKKGINGTNDILDPRTQHPGQSTWRRSVNSLRQKQSNQGVLRC